MKKNLLAMLMCIVALIGLSSCDDEGRNTDDAPFLGTWYGVDNNSTFTSYSDGGGWYTDDYGTTPSFSWDYDSDDLDLYLNDADGSFWEFAWSFSPEGYLSLYDLDYGGTTYYSH